MRNVVTSLVVTLMPMTAVGSPIYALTSDDDGIGTNDRLVKIDPSDGSSETIGRPGEELHRTFGSLSFDGNGRLLATEGDELYSLDTETAQPTRISDLPNSLSTLTLGESNLNGIQGFGNYTFQGIDPNTGTTSPKVEIRPINNDNASRAFSIKGASYNKEDGRVYTIDYNAELYSFSTTDVLDDGEQYVNAPFIGKTGLDFSDGAFADSGRLIFTDEGLLAVDNNGIFSIDIKTLETSLLTELAPSAGDPYALAFNGALDDVTPENDMDNEDMDDGNGDPGTTPVNAVPESSSFAMLALGLFGLISVSTRKKTELAKKGKKPGFIC